MMINWKLLNATLYCCESSYVVINIVLMLWVSWTISAILAVFGKYQEMSIWKSRSELRRTVNLFCEALVLIVYFMTCFEPYFWSSMKIITTLCPNAFSPLLFPLSSFFLNRCAIFEEDCKIVSESPALISIKLRFQIYDDPFNLNLMLFFFFVSFSEYLLDETIGHTQRIQDMRTLMFLPCSQWGWGPFSFITICCWYWIIY